jgi:hypothetical protein
VSTVRRAEAGATRTCPHCRTLILQSAAICPACRKHLRFESGAVAAAALPSFSPLRVEASIRHPEAGEAWEYSVVVSIKNERGDEVTRHVVGVGALQPGEERAFSLSVEVFTPDATSALAKLRSG